MALMIGGEVALLMRGGGPDDRRGGGPDDRRGGGPDDRRGGGPAQLIRRR